MEKLIPFDFEAFKADPSRLRHRDELKASRSSVALGDSVAAIWDTGRPKEIAVTYLPDEFYLLRLAAKTRIVRVRLLQDKGDKRVWAYTSDYNNVEQAVGSNRDWIGDAFDVEVPA